MPRALERLREVGKLLGVSAAYRNPAVGPEPQLDAHEPTVGLEPQPDYLNAAALLEVAVSRADLRLRLRAIEIELGRVRTEDKYAPRTIDLDLVWLSDGDHPAQPPTDSDILERAHLAIPLAELAPEQRHSSTGETLHEIARRLAAGAELAPDDELTAALRAIVADQEGG